VENRCDVFVGRRGQFRVIDDHVILPSAEFQWCLVDKHYSEQHVEACQRQNNC